jgi:hypothetical protein
MELGAALVEPVAAGVREAGDTHKSESRTAFGRTENRGHRLTKNFGEKV